MTSKPYFLFSVVCVAFLFSIFYFPFSEITCAVSVSINASIPSVCGNGVLDAGEQCDGSQLGGQTCASQGFSGGTLSCNSNCTFNTSACTTSGGGSGGGGGGGGGGGTSITSTSAIFKGIAYPSSDVTLLENAQVVAVAKAGPDASFEIDVSNVAAGTYSFGVWASDALGNRSITQTFVITITSGATTVVSGIFLPPTIGVDKVQVKRGDVLSIFGYTAPQATVSVIINSGNEIVKNTTSSNNGYYLYKFNSEEVDYGDHTTHSRAATADGNVTTDSNFVSFTAGDKNVFAATSSAKCAVIGDLNGDCRVNLIDFSIMAYWYKRPNPPTYVDLNGDGVIDLTDFSILAYYWTG